MINIRISSKLTLLGSVMVWILYPVSAYADALDKWECWNGYSLASREGAVCAIQERLEMTWEHELRDILERRTDLVPGDINKVIPELFLQWAECKYEAVVDFSAKRSDIPLRLLLEPHIYDLASDEKIIWLNQQTGFEPHYAELDKCEDEWAEAVRRYLPDSGHAE